MLSARDLSVQTTAEDDSDKYCHWQVCVRLVYTEDSATAAKKLFHVLVMNVGGSAFAVIRGNIDMNKASAWRALITRYAPNAAPRIQSLMSAIINVKTFPSELTAYEGALDERQENIRQWELISGDRFDESMMKALLLDKAPSSARVHSRCRIWIPSKRWQQ